MNKSDSAGAGGSAGWVLYDGECPVCRSWVERIRPPLSRRGFEFAPLQTSWARELLALPPEKLLEEMKVLTPDGAVIGGADAALYLAKHIWYTSPLYALAWIPGMKPVMRSVYRRYAARRHCSLRPCAVKAVKP